MNAFEQNPEEAGTEAPLVVLTEGKNENSKTFYKTPFIFYFEIKIPVNTGHYLMDDIHELGHLLLHMLPLQTSLGTILPSSIFIESKILQGSRHETGLETMHSKFYHLHFRHKDDGLN